MSLKTYDAHGRWRSKTIAFRMSQEEADLLDDLVAVSGLTKQDYLISKALDRSVLVKPNPRVQKALREELESLASELSRLTRVDEARPEALELANHLASICESLSGKAIAKVGDPDREIFNMGR